MQWSLFLDDERVFSQSQLPNDWIIVRSVPNAKELIEFLGMPWRVSLDHDLGAGMPTGYDFVKWLVEQDMNLKLDIAEITDFYVHSQNPIGTKNMNDYYNNYMEQR